MNQLRTRLLGIEETANYLGIAPKTLRNRLGPRAINPFPVKPKRIGKRVLFDIKALDAFIESLPTTYDR
jgi:predicted DNA-binding transcriptional regulator AlpA